MITFRRIEDMLPHFRVLYPLLALCYIGLMFYFSSLPDSSLNVGNSKPEKVFWNLAHIPFYGTLAILLTLTHKSTWRVLIVALCVAILDETNQAAVPGRMASLIDFLLDAFGITAGLWISHSLLRK